MFGKSSIEDFVKFCLSLLLRFGIANHRQKECPNCRSSGIFSGCGIAPSSKKKGITVQMVGLTQIHLDGNIFQQINVLVRGVGILDLFQCLCDERGIIVTTGLRTYASSSGVQEKC